jgi:hypothetical protein
VNDPRRFERVALRFQPVAELGGAEGVGIDKRATMSRSWLTSALIPVTVSVRGVGLWPSCRSRALRSRPVSAIQVEAMVM